MSMNELILSVIKKALGSNESLFEIKFDECLVDDEDIYSATFSFKPNPTTWEDSRTVGGKHSLQFDVEKDGDDVYLIYGEDDQVDVSIGNIYGLLYWHEAIETV